MEAYEKLWGAILTVEHGREQDISNYLHERETVAYGYELQEIDLLWPDGSSAGSAPVYVVQPDRPGWVGPLPLCEVADRLINAEHSLSYVYSLALHLSRLTTDRDTYLDELCDVLAERIEERRSAV